jgi:hypothetical protein
MKDDEPEIFPPGKRLVPVKREESRTVPAAYNDSMLQPRGVIETALTGFQAQWQARAYRNIAENIRAQTDALDAETARRDSAMKLIRKTGELHDIKDILALDKAERAAERAAKYASLTAQYDKIDDDHDERAHKRKLTELRRQREIEEATAKLVEAKRGTFNATQGLENQERIKQLKMEMWENRAAIGQGDAEKMWTLLKREVEAMNAPQQKSGEGSLEQLAEMRASLVQRAQEAAAQGHASKAERYAHLAAELDELVIAAMRGRPQE